MNNIPRTNDFPPQNDFLFVSISATNHFYHTTKITNILNHFSRWIVAFFKKRKFDIKMRLISYTIQYLCLYVCLLIYTHILLQFSTSSLEIGPKLLDFQHGTLLIYRRHLSLVQSWESTLWRCWGLRPVKKWRKKDD